MTEAEAPPLVGLVLAGGLSQRMGRDKGALVYHGSTQAEYCAALLGRFCGDVYVSVRRSQALEKPYRDMRTIPDDGDYAGPAAGLLAAWRREPEAALLVLAVDMPLVDSGVLTSLVTCRDPARLATAFRQANGRLEPLCAIWEPLAAQILQRAGAAHGSISLRRCLEESDIRALKPGDDHRLRSVNTREAFREILDRIEPGKA